MPSRFRWLLGAAGNAHERALLSLAITTGVRQGEIFALCWGDVDLAAGAVYLKKNLAKDREGRVVRTEPKTPNSRRVIYMPELARKGAVWVTRAPG